MKEFRKKKNNEYNFVYSTYGEVCTSGVIWELFMKYYLDKIIIVHNYKNLLQHLRQ